MVVVRSISDCVIEVRVHLACKKQLPFGNEIRFSKKTIVLLQRVEQSLEVRLLILRLNVEGNLLLFVLFQPGLLLALLIQLVEDEDDTENELDETDGVEQKNY